MCRSLVRHHIWDDAPPHQLGVDLGGITDQADRERLSQAARLAYLVQRLVQRTRHLVAIPRLQAPLDMLRVNLYGKADAFIHGDGEWLRYSRQMSLNEAICYPA